MSKTFWVKSGILLTTNVVKNGLGLKRMAHTGRAQESAAQL